MRTFFDLTFIVSSTLSRKLILTKTYSNNPIFKEQTIIKEEEKPPVSGILLHHSRWAWFSDELIQNDITGAYFTDSFLADYECKITTYQEEKVKISNRPFYFVEGSRRIIGFRDMNRFVVYNVDTCISFRTEKFGTFFDAGDEVIFLTGRKIVFLNPHTLITSRKVKTKIRLTVYHLASGLYVAYNYGFQNFDYYQLDSNDELRKVDPTKF